MSDQSPLVSVLICTYNAQDFLIPTLKSILKQTYKKIEILILDNNSKDKTVDIINKFKRLDKRIILYRSVKNIGAYNGLNKLLLKAKGKYIAIQDHDDIWYKDKLTIQANFLENNQKYIGCGTAIINYYEKFNTYLLRSQPKIASIAWHTSFMFRNLKKYYDTSIKVGNDFLFMKCSLCNNKKLIYNFSQPFVLRRIREDRNNLSRLWVNWRNIRDIISIKLNFIDRISLIYRLLIPHNFANFLIIKIFLRNKVINKQNIKKDKILNYLFLMTSAKLA